MKWINKWINDQSYLENVLKKHSKNEDFKFILLVHRVSSGIIYGSSTLKFALLGMPCTFGFLLIKYH